MIPEPRCSLALGALLLGLAACSDSSSSSPPAPEADAGADADAAAAPTPFTVWVYGQRQLADVDEAPIAGATVAFDPPGGGERVEKATEADGHVTFEADFAQEGGAVTVVAADHVAVSVLEASPENAKKTPTPFGKTPGDLVVVAPLAAPSTVTLSGAITNKLAADNYVLLTATGTLDAAETTGDTYALAVPKDHAFTIVGHEGKPGAPQPRNIENGDVRMFRIDRPASSANATFDVDPAVGALAAPKVKWTVELPGGDTGPLGATSRCIGNVATFDSNVILGPLIRSTTSASGFDLELQVAQTDLGAEIVMSRVFVLLQDGSRSVAVEPGSLPDGTVIKDLVAPPPVTIDRQRLRDPIPVEGFPPNAFAVVQLFGPRGLFWSIFTPYQKAPTGPLTLPAPPSALQLPPSLAGRLLAFGSDSAEVRPGLLVTRRIGMSREFSLSTK